MKIQPINRIHSPILFHYILSIQFIQSFPHVIQLESPPNSTFYRLFKKIDLGRAYSLGAIPPLVLGVDLWLLLLSSRLCVEPVR